MASFDLRTPKHHDAGAAPDGRKSVRHMDALDGLRGAAAFVVVFIHLGGRLWPTLFANHHTIASDLMRALGHDAVFSFFVLSGFLVSGPFVRWALFPETRRPSVGRYSALRAARILPTWWIVLAVYVITQWPHGTALPRDLGASLVLMQNFIPSVGHRIVGPSWTLTIEVCFYVALPLVMLPVAALVRRLRPAARVPALASVLVGLAVVSAAARAQWFGVFWPSSDFRPLTFSLPLFADSFLWGMLAAVVVERRTTLSRNVLRAMLTAAVGLWLWSSIGVTSLSGWDSALIAPLFGLLVTALALEPRLLLARTLAVRPLVRLGVLSYGLYLWHVPIAELFERRGGIQPGTVSGALEALVVFVISLALAHVMWEHMDRPILGWVRRAGRPTANPAASPTVAVAATWDAAEPRLASGWRAPRPEGDRTPVG